MYTLKNGGGGQLAWAENTHYRVQLVTSLNGLNSTEQENMLLLFVCSKATESKQSNRRLAVK